MVNQPPIQKVYNISLSNPIGNYTTLNRIFEDIMPSDHVSFSSVTVHERKQIIDYLTCCNIHYNIYEFNGVSLVKLNTEYNLSNITLEEHLPYYYNSHMVIRKCAKLFYKLSIHEKKIYKVEIRWKGNIYNSSPQFQIHDEI